MFLHLALNPHPQGLSSGKVEGLGELTLRFAEAELQIRPQGGQPTTSIPFNERTAASLFDETVESIRAAGVSFTPEWESDATVLSIDNDDAAAYSEVLLTHTDALAGFREGLEGTTSPVVVWSHGFDAAFAWFPGEEIDEHQPHIAFGFSPDSEGFTAPYLYSYAYPWPEELPA